MNKIIFTAALLFCHTLHAEIYYSGQQFGPWQEMTKRMTVDDCNAHMWFCTPIAWQSEINKMELMPVPARLAEATKYINHKYPYKHFSDKWATPQELISAGVGDCKDHAIAKMAILIASGLAEEKMKIVVLHDDKNKFMHAVLMYGKNVLDDQNDNVVPMPSYYTAYYGINFDGWWQYVNLDTK